MQHTTNQTDTRALLAEALESRVSFVPGTAFFMDHQGGNCQRLKFSHVEPARINEGVQRLARVVTKYHLNRQKIH